MNDDQTLPQAPTPLPAVSLPLPPLLLTSDPGSFARRTIVERKPQLIQQVLDENPYPQEIVQALLAFRHEIAYLPFQPLTETAPDAAEWNAELARYTGQAWLEAPWYFAETFFYRKLLQAVRYFQPGAWKGRNPFQPLKERQMQADVQRLASEWDAIFDLPPRQAFETLLHSALWGNRADLSNFTVQAAGRGGAQASLERQNILVNHTPQIEARLCAGLPRLDFINDNVGADVLFDLALSDFVLRQGWADAVVFHLKSQPFFVSDAMPDDIHRLVSLLRTAATPAARQLGQRLLEHLAGGRIHLATDPFWVSFRMLRQMPPALYAHFAGSGLVLLKGDVNYRRLLDDRRWPPATPLEAITAYFPAPFAALRTLKGEIIAGLPPGQAEALQAADPTWLINGQRGLIQMGGVPSNGGGAQDGGAQDGGA